MVKRLFTSEAFRASNFKQIKGSKQWQFYAKIHLPMCPRSGLNGYRNFFSFGTHTSFLLSFGTAYPLIHVCVANLSGYNEILLRLISQRKYNVWRRKEMGSGMSVGTSYAAILAENVKLKGKTLPILWRLALASSCIFFRKRLLLFSAQIA